MRAALTLAALAAITAAPAVASPVVCDGKAYQKSALLHLASTKLASVFSDARGMRQFEASAVSIEAGTGRAAIIFDNAHAVGVLDPLLPWRPSGALHGRRRAAPSDYEGIAWGEGGTVLALAEGEAVEGGDGVRKARIDEFALPSDSSVDPTLIRSCPVEYELHAENKGLEDLVSLSPGRALALCEGNRCLGGAPGREPGHGRMLAVTRGDGEGDGGGGGCRWVVDRVVGVPPDAAFSDYAGLALRNGWLAVLSQEDAAVFVGRFNASTLEFAPHDPARDARRVFGLPRTPSCDRTFCNAEGIDFVDDPGVRGPARVVVVTDKARPGSPWPCVQAAEAIHLFSLPRKAIPQPDPVDGEGVAAA